MSDSSKSKKVEAVKKILKEEIKPSEKREIEGKLCNNIEKLVDHILVGYDCHKKGLSEQQAAFLFHKIVSTVDDKLQEFTTQKRPSSLSNVEEIIEKLDI